MPLQGTVIMTADCQLQLMHSSEDRSEVQHDIALVKVQAECALPYRQPLSIVTLPLIPGCRRRKLQISSNLRIA